MTGDTTNLMADEHEWYFHTPNPGTDLGTELNPHFDSLEGLKEEPAFLREPDGLDCVLILSCGPFDLPVGRRFHSPFVSYSDRMRKILLIMQICSGNV